MATFVKFYCFPQDIGRKVHNLHTDTLKIALTNSAPVAASNTVLADITQIAASGGYSSGGSAVTGQSYTQTSGTAKLDGTGPTFTATGTLGPFRYAVLYNSTASGGPLISYYDYGSSITLNNAGETFIVDMTTNVDIATLA